MPHARPIIRDSPLIDRLSLGSAASAVLLLAACTRPAPHPERLYVSNERGDQVVAIDPVAGEVVRTFAPGKRPRGLRLAPDGAHLYVAVSGSPIARPGIDEDELPPPDHHADGIAVIDLASGAIERVLPAGEDPETLALSPDGHMLYAADVDAGAVSAVAADGRAKTITAKVGEDPEGLAVSADGARLFVACGSSNHVVILDARTLKPIRTIGVTGRPRGLLLSRDGRIVFVSAESAGRLTLISATDGAPVGQIDLAQGERKLKPMGIVQAPDGHLFVTTGRYGAVIEVDPGPGKIVRTIAHVGARPWGIALSGDGRLVATANGPSNDVSLIDRNSAKVVRKFKAGEGPWGIAA